MKLWRIVGFEVDYQIRRVRTWLFFAVVGVVAFTMVRYNFLPDALYDNFFVNSPFVITVVSVFGGFVWVLSAAPIAGEAAARDIETGIYSLVYTSPISKLQYVGGRYLAALAVNFMLLLAIPLGITLAVYTPGTDAAVIGPFHIEAYLIAFCFINIPVALATTAIQFSFALVKGRPVASYLGSLLMFVIAYPVCGAISYFWSEDLARLIDPIGVGSVVMEFARTWTPVEKSTRLYTLEGTMPWNRMIWIGVTVLTMAFTFLQFHFSHYVTRSRSSFLGKRKDLKMSQPLSYDIAGSAMVAIPEVRRTFGVRTYLKQLAVITWSAFWTVVRRRGGFVIFSVMAFLSFLGIPKDLYGMEVPLLPRTEYLLTFLTAPLDQIFSPWPFIPPLIIIFAGELIWRERESNVAEITHTAPVPEWILFLGKYSGLSLVFVAWMAALTIVGRLIQLLMGYHEHEAGLFLRVLFGLQLPDYLLFISLVFFIHTVVNQKYVGHLACLCAYGAITMAWRVGIHHHLLVFGSDPGRSYTDMLGFDAFLIPWLWFKSYWMAWALLIAIGTRLFWVRSKDHDLKSRIRLAGERFTRSTMLFSGIVVMLIISLGGFIFYNTNILNEYHTASESDELAADYEKSYKRFENIPQPNLAGVNLTIDLHPAGRAAEIHGIYHLINKRDVPIDSIHLDVSSEVNTENVSLNVPFNTVKDDRLRHHVYVLDKPLRPDDSIDLTFDLIYKAVGFHNNGIDRYVMADNTYFSDEQWMPFIGYRHDRELRSSVARRSHGLGPKPLIPSLYDVGKRFNKNGSDHYSFEAVLSTDEDQVAIAPGSLRRSWSDNGRRYFHYATNAPVGQYKIFSSAYSVRDTLWRSPIDTSKTVKIEIFYHPKHPQNLDRILTSSLACLDYYTTKFSPYEYDVLRFVERPGRGQSLHAEATTVDYQEGFSLFNPDDVSTRPRFDLVFAVIGHEVGHQWWGAQLPIALVEGVGVMGESLAWYSSIGVFENVFGKDGTRRLLRFFRQPYPVAPVPQSAPLINATNDYAAYRKGPFALYCLSEYAGRDTIDFALHQLLAHHISRTGPKATTLDLYKELQDVVPDSLRNLLHDLFEANTFWELKTNNAVAKQNNDSTWDVAIDVLTRKITVDSAGVETVIPMNDWIEIGVFADSTVLYQQKHLISSGTKTVTVKVPSKPTRAGIDPHVLLIDLKPENNSRDVEIKE